jgi:hypothetical protein
MRQKGIVKKSLLIAVIGAVITYVLADNTSAFMSEIKRTVQHQRNVWALVSEAKGIGGGTVLLPLDLLFDFAHEASNESLKSIVKGAEQWMLDEKSVRTFADNRHLHRGFVKAVWRSFTEDEQALIARATIMAMRPDDGGLSIKLFSGNESRDRFGVISKQEAIKFFLSGQAGAIVLYKTDQSSIGVSDAVVKEFGDYFLFLPFPTRAAP